MRVLILGPGYVGMRLGRELAQAGHQVWGARRSATDIGDFKAAGINLLTVDLTKEQDLERLPGPFDWIVNCAATRGGSPEDYRALYLEGARALAAWLAAQAPAKLIYTSSTSVYGQNDGSLVTEDSPAEPSAETGRILVASEQVYLEAARARRVPAVVLRLAGIYGPDRGFWLKQFLSGEARIDGDGTRVLNMIHRDDVVGAIIAALERGQAGQVYNVVDDEPASQKTVFEWLAAKLGRPLPSAAQEPAGHKRGTTNKKVSNRKLKEQLGYRLQYATFREGFATELERLGIKDLGRKMGAEI